MMMCGCVSRLVKENEVKKWKEDAENMRKGKYTHTHTHHMYNINMFYHVNNHFFSSSENSRSFIYILQRINVCQWFAHLKVLGSCVAVCQQICPDKCIICSQSVLCFTCLQRIRTYNNVMKRKRGNVRPRIRRKKIWWKCWTRWKRSWSERSTTTSKLNYKWHNCLLSCSNSPPYVPHLFIWGIKWHWVLSATYVVMKCIIEILFWHFPTPTSQWRFVYFCVHLFVWLSYFLLCFSSS